MGVRFLALPLWLLWLSLPLAIVFAMVSPVRCSLVEGCAGDLGYDELNGRDS